MSSRKNPKKAFTGSFKRNPSVPPENSQTGEKIAPDFSFGMNFKILENVANDNEESDSLNNDKQKLWESYQNCYLNGKNQQKVC